MCQNLVPLVNIKIAGKWMFIPLKMVLIGTDPYPFKNFIPTKSWELFDRKCLDVVMIKQWDVMVHDGQNSQTLGWNMEGPRDRPLESLITNIMWWCDRQNMGDAHYNHWKTIPIKTWPGNIVYHNFSHCTTVYLFHCHWKVYYLGSRNPTGIYVTIRVFTPRWEVLMLRLRNQIAKLLLFGAKVSQWQENSH